MKLKGYLYGGALRFPFMSMTSTIGSPRTKCLVVILQKAFCSAVNYARMLASKSYMLEGGSVIL